jgi:hypothetical protein
MPHTLVRKVAMTLSTLPTRRTLVHPLTGAVLAPIGYRRNGAPIWPVMGGDDTVDPAPEPTPAPGDPAPKHAAPPDPKPDPAPKPADPPKPGDELGDAGKKALAAEREARKSADDARKAADKTVADLNAKLAKLAPLEKLAAALGDGDPGKGKTEIELLSERLAEQEKATLDERAARWRAEVAQEKGLTKKQSARLTGSTYDELAADADELLSLFPKPDTAEPPKDPAPPADPPKDPKPPAPKPDPSQGSRGDAPTRSQGLAAAVSKAMASPK